MPSPPTQNRLAIAVLADGRSIHTVRWVEWLVAAGHHVHLFTDSPYDGSLDVAVREVPPMRRIKRSTHLLRQLRSEIEALKPDVLHAHFLLGYGHVAWLTRIRPLALTAWGSDLMQSEQTSVASRYLTRCCVRGAALCTADSPTLLERLRQLGAADRARLVGFGIDPAFFKPQQKTACRRRLGLDAPGPLIVSPRSVRALYNIETVVVAFARLRTELPGAHLVIKDYFGDPAYVASVRTLVRRHGLAQSVTWLNDLPRAELPTLYGAADVIVSLATTDSFPLTMWESFAARRPLVASNVSGIKEAFEPIDHWLLATPTDAHDVARALRAALVPAEILRPLLDRYQRTSRRWADTDTEMQWLEKLYDAALRQRPLPVRDADRGIVFADTRNDNA